MKLSKYNLVLTAAFTGLTGGIAARAVQAPLVSSNSSAASVSPAGPLFADKKQIEKHACKGLNTCKGNGGGTKKEWGKNSCKGKGGCATDGTKPDKMKM